MEYRDKKLICKDCSQEFVWSAGEQRFFAEKGFDKEPVRCLKCRKKKKEQTKDIKEGSSFTVNEAQMCQIQCKKCGKISEIPFSPREPENILCSQCFEESLVKK